jgi:membrane protein
MNEILKKAIFGWLNDDAPSMGAALAFYSILSLAPLLIIAISIAGLFFGEEAARGALFAQISQMVGADGAKAIQAMLSSSVKSGDSTLSTVIGAVTFAVGATTVFAELQRDLNKILKTPSEQTRGFVHFLIARVFSFGIILGIGFLLAVSLVFDAIWSSVRSFPTTEGLAVASTLQVINLVISFAISSVLFAMMYRFLPSIEVRWRNIWIGAVMTALLFSFGKFVIGFYIGTAAIASSFGAAGTFVAVIIWVYYSSQIFLFGAEVIAALSAKTRQGKAALNVH